MLEILARGMFQALCLLGTHICNSALDSVLSSIAAALF